MEIFEDMIKIHAGKTRHAVMKIAQVQMPSIFLPRSRLETFQGFPDSIARKKAAIVAAEAKAALDRARKKTRRSKPKGRAPTMQEKQDEMEELFDGESNHQVLPSRAVACLHRAGDDALRSVQGWSAIVGFDRFALHHCFLPIARAPWSSSLAANVGPCGGGTSEGSRR